MRYPFSKFEMLALILLLIKYSQRYALRLFSTSIKRNIGYEEVIKNSASFEVSEKNFTSDFNTVFEIMIDSLPYVSVAVFGLFSKNSFNISFTKLLVFMITGCFLCIFLVTAFCGAAIYYLAEIKDQLLKISTTFFAFCSQVLFVFNLIFELPILLFLSILCNSLITLTVDIFFVFSDLFVNLIISCIEYIIHFVYIVLHHDVMNKFTISKNVHILNNVFFAFSVFFLNSLFTQLISKFGFLKFLDSEFLLFWSITSFNESYCMIFLCSTTICWFLLFKKQS